MDLSWPLLSSDSDNFNGNFVRANMLNLPFADSSFDRIINFFTSFGYFDNEIDNYNVLKNIYRILKNNGKFVLDLPNKTSIINNLIPYSKKIVENIVVEEFRNFNNKSNRVEKRITLHTSNGTKEYLESVRLYSLEEIKTILIDSNLKLVDCFGDFIKNKLYNTEDSSRMILIGEKS